VYSAEAILQLKFMVCVILLGTYIIIIIISSSSSSSSNYYYYYYYYYLVCMKKIVLKCVFCVISFFKFVKPSPKEWHCHSVCICWHTNIIFTSYE